MRAPLQPYAPPPFWWVILTGFLRLAFLAVLFAWLGRSVLLLGEERDLYSAFQRGLVLIPETLSLVWEEIVNFTAPLSERLFAPQPVFIGIGETPPSSAPLPPVSFTLSPALVQSCMWIAGAQALVTLWVLIARRDAARMWTGPGVLAVLEPRARVIFVAFPLALAGWMIARAWQASLREALLIAAFALILKLFPFLTGLPFWFAEEVIGIDFSALRTLIPVPRKRPVHTKPLTPLADGQYPDYAGALSMLGLLPDCTADEALEAYRAHMRINHPGRGGENGQVQALHAAFAAIKRARGWA